MEPNKSRIFLQTGPDTGANWTEPGTVSYTHLDVYKRQVSSCKLDLTLVPTGPSLGRSLSLLLAGCLAGPCA
ncbi:hypothetical protein AAES_117942 [Amazona aestiva]|uniref:Uncharacterized protein n=1 Tax=Amazona aestiva TaxID=12930 RepID=A0A0Q3URM4_AMAAE|nr:hypothetical protein AAES_117942 [Amazona aestiva]